MAEEKKAPPQSITTALINLAMGNDTELFKSPEGDLYATIWIRKDVQETVPLLDREFRNWLSRLYFITQKKGVGGSSIADAVNTLAGSAQAKGDVKPVYTRVASLGDVVYLDLCREDCKVVKITGEGWQVLPAQPECRFAKRRGMLPLPIPVRGRPASELLPKVINVQEDTTELKMLIGWMIGVLRGLKPYPMLILVGEQGSAKSVSCRLIRNCLDPSQASLSTTPKEARDLLITARNSHVIGFDNLSFVPDWLSDILCSVATGAGFRTRALTTDSTEQIFAAARPIVMNSIADIVRRGDLMDRAIVINTKPISDEERRTEADVEAMLQEVQPEILGSLLDAISQSLKCRVKLKRMPRMADFAVTVESAAPALGWEPLEFLNLYESVRKESAEVLLEGDLITAAIVKMQEEDAGQTWCGTSEVFKDRILRLTPEAKHSGLPKTSKSLVNHLRRIVPAMRMMGVRISLPKPTKVEGGKVLRIMSIEYDCPTDQKLITFDEEESTDF